MTHRDPVARLPAEIRAGVLEYLGPRDLYAAIRSSRSLLLALNWSRRNILAQAVRNAIEPQAMNDALGVLYCPRFEKGDGGLANQQVAVRFDVRGTFLRQRGRSTGRSRLWELKMALFLKQHQEKRHPYPTEIRDLTTLLRLYNLVEKFVNDYVVSVGTPPYAPALPNFKVPMHHVTTRITVNERIRLQRAFFRYELWCRLCGLTELEVLLDTTGFGILRFDRRREYALMSHLKPSEREELMCVGQYVHSQYGLAFEDFEKGLGTPFENELIPFLSILDNLSPDQQMLPDDPHYHNMVRDRHLGAMGRFGLGFLDRFLQCSAPIRYCFAKMLHERHVHLGGPIGKVRCSRNWRHSGSVRGIGGCNELWHIARQDDCMKSLLSDHVDWMRDHGWAIWDRARLDSMSFSTVTQIKVHVKDAANKYGEGLRRGGPAPSTFLSDEAPDFDLEDIAREFRVDATPHPDDRLEPRPFVVALVTQTRIERDPSVGRKDWLAGLRGDGSGQQERLRGVGLV